jgi:uncharacterized protein (DUF488 family)
MDNKQPDYGLSVFTLGHSNHTDIVFLNLLRKHKIQIVVDIRSSPFTKYTPHFNRDPLAYILTSANIDYEYYGALLGGRPPESEYYDKEGHVLYGKMAESERFQEGISELLRLIRYSRVAILCSEEDPVECHRRLLVGRVLAGQDVKVIHIMGDGSLQSEDELAKAEELKKDKGQLGMFETQETKEWKSIRSVSPGNPQKNSSNLSNSMEYDY